MTKKRNLSLAFILLMVLLALIISPFQAAWLFNYQIEDNIEINGDKWPCKIDNYLVTNDSMASTPYESYASLEGAIKGAEAKIKEDSSKYKIRMFLDVKSRCLVFNKNLILTSGIFLYLPYEDIKYDISNDNEIANLKGQAIDTSKTNISKYKKGSITLKSSTLTIDSGAELFIGGEFGEKGVCKNYSEIDLDSNSKLIVKGKLTCNGYIKQYFESTTTRSRNLSSTNEPLVDVQSGGVYKTAVAFYNAAGGSSQINGLNDLDIFPISIFDFPNTQIKLKINSGATFKGCARLSRSNSMGTTNVNKEVTLIANSGALFNLTNGYILLHYKPNNNDGFTKLNTKTYINISGNVTLGFMKIDAALTISTETCFLPLSYKMQITIDKGATFNTVQYKIKLLPGALLVINGTFVNSSEVIAYTNSLAKGNVEGYYSSTPTPNNYITDNYDDALIIVNGTFKMEANAKLGAYLKTEKTDGTSSLDFSAVTSNSYLQCTSKEGLNNTPISIRSSTDFLDDDGSTIAVQLVASNKNIPSKEGYACFAENGKIKSYKLQILVTNLNNYLYPICGYQVYRIDGTTQTIISVEGVYLSTNNEFLLEENTLYKVISLDRASQTKFTLFNNSNTSLPNFVSNQQYSIGGKTEITIEVGEGVMCWFSVDSESGSGGSTATISESNTSNGTYFTVANGSGGQKIEVAIKKNSYIKYKYTHGFGAATTGDQYLFKGLKSGPTDNDKGSGTKYSNDKAIKIAEESTVHQYLEPQCLLPNAKVLLSDGTYKLAGDIRTGDMVMSFNHETGKIEPNVVIGNDHIQKDAELYNVVHLEFDNNQSTDFIYEHGYFDVTLNKYVYMHENDVEQYVGHEFVFVENNSITTSKLVKYSIKETYTTLAAPATANHLNLIVDDMLSIEGGLTGLFNIFEYDKDTLAFDKEKMQEDINTYGLLDYSYFEKYFPVEIYNLLPCKYLAVSIGKGLITWDIFEMYVDKWYDQLMDNI